MPNELVTALGAVDDGLDITAVTKLKHAALWDAAKRVGGVAALARRLGLNHTTVHNWINMRACPPRTAKHYRWSAERLKQLEEALFHLTGETMDELFPKELRENIQFLNSPKTLERTRRIAYEKLLEYAERTTQRLLESPIEACDFLDSASVMKDKLEQAMRAHLTEKQAEILRCRWGLGDEEPRDLTWCSCRFRLSRERIRQIEHKAMKILRNELGSFRELLDELEEMRV